MIKNIAYNQKNVDETEIDLTFNVSHPDTNQDEYNDFMKMVYKVKEFNKLEKISSMIEVINADQVSIQKSDLTELITDIFESNIANDCLNFIYQIANIEKTRIICEYNDLVYPKTDTENAEKNVDKADELIETDKNEYDSFTEMLSETEE